MKYALLFFLFFFVLQVEQVLAAPCMTPGITAAKIKICSSKKMSFNQSTCSCEGGVQEARKVKPTQQTKSPDCNSGLTSGNGCARLVGGKCQYNFGNCRNEDSCNANGGIFKENRCVDRSTDGFDINQPSSAVKTDAELCKLKNGIYDHENGCVCPDEVEKHSINPSDPNDNCEDDKTRVRQSDVLIKVCQERKGKYVLNPEDKNQTCECADGRKAYIIDLTFSDFTCQSEGAAKTGDVPSCLQDFKTKAKACNDNGKNAIEKCNKDNKNANTQWSAAQSVIGPMAQIMQMRGQQQGSAETCFQAGALATTTYAAMDLLKESCDQEIEVCQFKCHEAAEAYKEIDDKCRNEAVGKPEGYLAKLKQQAEKINSDLDIGEENCDSKAKTNQDTLIGMMNGMNKSAQQAAKCQCQLTAGQTNCDQILGPADCKLTPKDPRCPQAVTVKCAGTDYNTKECICLRDPKAVSCIGVSTGGPSTVAGFNPISTGGVSLKPTGGLGSGGIGDLGYDAAGNPISSDRSSGGVDSPFGVANSGGGYGGGGASGGGSDESGPAGAATDPEGKAGIAGMFNNLKTGLANLFGGPANKKGTTADGKKFKDGNNVGTGIDPNKWRPVGLRGIAGGNSIGSKNSDIFKTVNNQYNNQYHTLLTAPGEGPK